MNNNSEESRESVFDTAFRYKDTLYNTKSTLEVSLNTSTTDYKKFSPLKIGISVLTPDNLRRYCLFSYPELYELVHRIRGVINNNSISDLYDSSNPVTIDKKVYDVLLRFKFKESSNSEKCVVVGVVKNQSDFAPCILPLTIFYSLVDKLEYIINNDISIQQSLSNKILEKNKLDYMSQIYQTLRGLPVNISELLEDSIHSTNNSYTGSYPDNSNSEKIESENNFGEIDQFDRYISQNLDSFALEGDIPSTTQDKPTEAPVKSYMFEDVLNKDISNIESLVNRTILSDSKLESFSDTIEEESGVNPLKNYFSDTHIKSASYISEFLVHTINKDYILFGEKYPDSITALKIKPEKSDEEIFNLASDLFIIQSYIKNFRTLIEKRTSDPNQCKSDLHINYRLLSDFFTFSFVEEEDKTRVKNNILSRFRYFDSQGYFDKWNEELYNYNYGKITEKEIKEYIDLVLDKLPTMMGISTLHKKYYNEGSLILPPETEYNLNKITKEVAKLDVVKHMGYEIDEKSLKKCGIEKDDISDEVYDLFSGNVSKKERRSNILKYVDFFISEVPDDIRDNFREHINNLGNDDYDIENSPFDLNRFGENIVKGIYLWNKSNKIEKFTDFYSTCRDSLTTKDQILKQEDDEENIWAELG